jgi:hypothetical protein
MSTRSWNKSAAAGEAPNASTWRDRAEAAEAALVEAAEEVQDLEGRLSEIAAIAAPDQADQLARIEAKLDQLLQKGS